MLLRQRGDGVLGGAVQFVRRTMSAIKTDRHEALHLIAGFLKDNGLHDTCRSLCFESGLDVQSEELAPHVSLMRILLDWKRAFEARFNGTPRIIQAVQKQEVALTTHMGPPVLMNQLQQHQNPSQPTFQEPAGQTQAVSIQNVQQATFQMPRAQAQQELGGGPLQTVQYMTGAGGQILGTNQQLFTPQPVQVVQPQGAQAQFVITQPQGLSSGELGDHQVNGMRPQPNSGLMQPPRNLDGLSLPGGLPPRPPGVHASHSSSLYPNHDQPDQQDCSTRDTSPDWQPNDDDGGPHSQRNNNVPWLPTHLNPAHMLNAAARRSSSGGSLPPITKLKGAHDNLTQDVFLATINRVGPGAVAAQLFDFRRPQRGSSSSARRSAILNLDDSQHDAMYALAGCEDVNFLISNVQSDVRIAMHKVFGIDKESFTVWFKNRGRNPSKTQHAGAYSGKNGMKRARLSEAGLYTNGNSSPE